MRHPLPVCRRPWRLPLLLLGVLTPAAASDAINQEGRILGPLPTISGEIQQNTPQADAVMAALQFLPTDNPWNEDISQLPLASYSDAMIAQLRADSTSTYNNATGLRIWLSFPYIIIPNSQPTVDITINEYPSESDNMINGTTSAMPLPSDMPIESGSDKHALVLQPGTGFLYELFHVTTTSPPWTAGFACEFPLTAAAAAADTNNPPVNVNAPRPNGWTSADAAGLSILAGTIRYDEAERGMIEHAMRLVVPVTQTAYIYPATHEAGSTSNANEPMMGQRLRLKASFVIPSQWSTEERAVALALKKYGCLVADNQGAPMSSLGTTTDSRWSSNAWSHFTSYSSASTTPGGPLDMDEFEVVQATTLTTGPRTAPEPTLAPLPNLTTGIQSPVTLSGSATGSGLSYLWYVYPSTAPYTGSLPGEQPTAAPGTVTFGSPTALTTTATFSATGAYIILLKASDNLHTPVYQDCVVTVVAGSTTTASSTGTTGGSTTAGATAGSTAGATGNGTIVTGGSSGGSGGCGLGGGALCLLPLLGVVGWRWRRRSRR